MRTKYVISGLLASTLFSVAAFAQSTVPAPSRTPAASATTTETIIHISQWRGSKLVGVNVYNTKNERLGDINEILLDNSGKVSGVVIGVGGFLGMGERDILVGLDQLKFINEPLPATTGSASTTSARPARAANEQWYPDHAVMDVSKDQIKAMPQFKYSDHK
jgi:sporulation protein YlmC with PRC-barrel domain